MPLLFLSKLRQYVNMKNILREEGEQVTIGARIRDIRIKRGLTQADLGGDLVTPSMISQIEADRARPSYPLLSEIANRLGMPIEYFMNEMDNQFLFSAQIGIATYQIATQQPELALKYLEALEEPDQGLNFQDYMLALAQTYRQLKRYSEASSCLERLREIGYRMQDYKLLFDIYRESGRVEMDSNNREGAVHEWDQAIEFGETALAADAVNSVDLTINLIEVLLTLDQMTSLDDASSLAERPYLAKAQQLSTKTPDLRSVSEQLIQEASEALESDPGRAKILAEQANTLLTFSRLVEHAVVVQTRLAQRGSEHVDDPWQEAAKAMTTVYPNLFLTTECAYIEKFIREGDLDKAERRLAQVKSVFDETFSERRKVQYENVQLQIQLLESQVWLKRDRREEGRKQLEQLVTRFSESTSRDIQIKTYALLVVWYSEVGDTENVLYYCRLMESMVDSDAHSTPLFI